MSAHTISKPGSVLPCSNQEQWTLPAVVQGGAPGFRMASQKAESIRNVELKKLTCQARCREAIERRLPTHVPTRAAIRDSFLPGSAAPVNMDRERRNFLGPLGYTHSLIGAIGALMNRVRQPHPLIVLGLNVWMGTAAGADELVGIEDPWYDFISQNVSINFF